MVLFNDLESIFLTFTEDISVYTTQELKQLFNSHLGYYIYIYIYGTILGIVALTSGTSLLQTYYHSTNST